MAIRTTFDYQSLLGWIAKLLDYPDPKNPDHAVYYCTLKRNA